MKRIILSLGVVLGALIAVNGKTSIGSCGWASPTTPVTGFDYSIISGKTFYVNAYDSSVKSDTTCMHYDFTSENKVTYS